MAETDVHYRAMRQARESLDAYYADDPEVYVSGNLLVFYVPGDRRRHLAPDVLVSKDVGKHDRPHYLVWEEGKGPDLVIEITSSSTRDEDVRDKFQLYEDTLKVREYSLFDPLGEYLKPRLQGYRLHRGKYVRIRAVRGRLPSRVLGLHLEAAGAVLRFYDPAARQWLPTPEERIARAEAENERLRRELDELRRRS